MSGKGFGASPSSPSPEGDGSTPGGRGRSYGGSSVPQQGSGIGQGSSSALDLWNSSVPAALQVKTQGTLDRYLKKYHAGELSGSSRNKRIERAIDSIYGENIPRDLTTWEDILSHAQRQTTTEEAYEGGEQQFGTKADPSTAATEKATNKALKNFQDAQSGRRSATEKATNKQEAISGLRNEAKELEESIKYSSSGSTQKQDGFRTVASGNRPELAKELQWNEGVFSFDDPKFKTGTLDADGNPVNLISPELRAKLEKSYGGMGELEMGFEDVFDDVMQRIGGTDPDRMSITDDESGFVELAQILKATRERLVKQQADATQTQSPMTDMERAEVREESNQKAAEAKRLEEPSPVEFVEEEIWSGIEYEAANNFYYTLEDELGYPPTDLQETLARMGVSNLVKDPVSERNWYKEVRTKLDEVINRDPGGDTNPNIPRLRKTRDAIDRYINSMTGGVNQRLANANATVPGESTGRRTTYTEGGERIKPMGSAEPVQAIPNVETAPQLDTGSTTETSRVTEQTGSPVDMSNVNVQVVEDVTRPTNKETTLAEGTHKAFLMKRVAGPEGTFDLRPQNGTLIRGLNNTWYFEQVNANGQPVGWYKVDATAESTNPVPMDQDSFNSAIQAEFNSSGPYKAYIASEPIDVTAHADYASDNANLQSNDPAAMFKGPQEGFKKTEKTTPTLANTASTGDELLGGIKKKLGRPNVVQDVIGGLMEQLDAGRRAGESVGMPNAVGNIRDLALGGWKSFGLKKGIQALLGNQRLRNLAAKTRIPKPAPDAGRASAGIQVARGIPISYQRLDTVLTKLRQAGESGDLSGLDVNDLGVLYQAYQSNPTDFLDMLAAAENTTISRNKASLEKLAEGSVGQDYASIMERLGAQGEPNLAVDSIRRALYDENGNPLPETPQFTDLIQTAFSNNPDVVPSIESLHAIAASRNSPGTMEGRSEPATAWGDFGERARVAAETEFNSGAPQSARSQELTAFASRLKKLVGGEGRALFGGLSQGNAVNARVDAAIKKIRDLEIESKQLDPASPEFAANRAKVTELAKSVSKMGITMSANEAGGLSGVREGARTDRTIKSSTTADLDNASGGDENVLAANKSERAAGVAETGSDAGPIEPAQDSAGFTDGLSSMIGDEVMLAKIAADPRAYGFDMNQEQFNNMFMNLYVSSDIGRAGPDMRLPYPSVADVDFGAFQDVTNRLSKLQAEKAELLDRMTRGASGNDLPVVDLKKRLTGRQTEFDLRKQGSETRIAEIDKEMAMLQNEVRALPGAESALNSIGSYLDQIQTRHGTKVSKETKPYNNGLFGLGIQRPTTAADTTNFTDGIRKLRENIISPFRIKEGVDLGSNTQNFVANMDNGDLPDSKSRWSVGDVAAAPIRDIQKTRLAMTLTDDEKFILREISAGNNPHLSEKAKAVLVEKINGARTWAMERFEQGASNPTTPVGDFGKGFANMPEPFIDKETAFGTTRGINPEYLRWTRGQELDEAGDSVRNQVRNSAVPYANFTTELEDVIKSVQGTKTQPQEGAASSATSYGSGQNYGDAVFAGDLRDLLVDPTTAPGAQVEDVAFGTQGVSKVFANSNNEAAVNALKALKRKTYIDDGSFNDQPAQPYIRDTEESSPETELFNQMLASLGNDADASSISGMKDSRDALELERRMKSYAAGLKKQAADALAANKPEVAAEIERTMQTVLSYSDKIARVPQEPDAKPNLSRYDLPYMTKGAKRVNGQLYVMINVPNKGFNSRGEMEMQSRTLWVPVGESVSDLNLPMIQDSRSAGNQGDSRYYEFDTSTRQVEAPKVDTTVVNPELIKSIRSQSTPSQLEAKVVENQGPTPEATDSNGYKVREDSETAIRDKQIEEDRVAQDAKNRADEEQKKARADRIRKRIRTAGKVAGAMTLLGTGGYIADKAGLLGGDEENDQGTNRGAATLQGVPYSVAPRAKTAEEHALEMMQAKKRPLLNYSSQKPMRGAPTRRWK